jgi:voltage-gated sodium channel
MLIVFYVSAVVTTNLFGKEFPEFFGNLGSSFFTLFQVMTLESWSDGIARPVMEKFPYAWVFFLFFILCATFVVVNLFIAVIVDSLSASNQNDKSASELDEVKLELKELKNLIIKQQDLIGQLTQKINS